MYALSSFVLTLIICWCTCLSHTTKPAYGRYQRDSESSNGRIVVKLSLTDDPDLASLDYDTIESGHGEPISRPYTPVVMWHGMGDTAFGSIQVIRKALERQYKGIQVYSIMIGKNNVEDELAGYFGNLNSQIDEACKAVIDNVDIRERGAFNAIGFSQGGQFLRGLIQRCPLSQHGIKVKNYISLGGQHQGVYGLPNCLKPSICDYIRFVLTNAVYEKSVQDNVVQAQYWHDPTRELEYREKNIFLSDINNELTINETYKKQLTSLDNLVLVQFAQDEMVIPRESSLFGFYASNQTDKIVSLKQSNLYMEDRLGLKKLDQTNRLKLITIPGHHLQYSISWFLSEIGRAYLDN